MKFSHEVIETANALKSSMMSQDPEGNILRALATADTDVLLALLSMLHLDFKTKRFESSVERIVDIRVSDIQLGANERLRQAMLSVEANQRRVEILGLRLAKRANLLAGIAIIVGLVEAVSIAATWPPWDPVAVTITTSQSIGSLQNARERDSQALPQRQSVRPKPRELGPPLRPEVDHSGEIAEDELDRIRHLRDTTPMPPDHDPSS